MTWRVEETENGGYEKVLLLDLNGVLGSLQQSSVALCEPPGSSAVWLGPEGHRLHMKLSHVKQLHHLLGNWIESGSFKG